MTHSPFSWLTMTLLGIVCIVLLAVYVWLVDRTSRARQRNFYQKSVSVSLVCVPYQPLQLLKQLGAEKRRPYLLGGHLLWLTIAGIALGYGISFYREGYKSAWGIASMALLKVPWFVYAALLYWPISLRRSSTACVTENTLVVAGISLFAVGRFALWDWQNVRVPLDALRSVAIRDGCIRVQYRFRWFKTATLLLPRDAKLEAALENALHPPTL